MEISTKAERHHKGPEGRKKVQERSTGDSFDTVDKQRVPRREESPREERSAAAKSGPGRGMERNPPHVKQAPSKRAAICPWKTVSQDQLERLSASGEEGLAQQRKYISKHFAQSQKHLDKPKKDRMKTTVQLSTS